jgi:hypothetical protein
VIAALLAAWSWVKSHAALCGGILVALLGFLFGFVTKKSPIVVTGVDPVKTKAEQDLKTAEAQVATQDAQAKQAATTEHASDVTAVVTEEQKQEPALQTNDDATNTYLKDIGNQVRGGSDGGQPK